MCLIRKRSGWLPNSTSQLNAASSRISRSVSGSFADLTGASSPVLPVRAQTTDTRRVSKPVLGVALSILLFVGLCQIFWSRSMQDTPPTAVKPAVEQPMLDERAESSGSRGGDRLGGTGPVETNGLRPSSPQPEPPPGFAMSNAAADDPAHRGPAAARAGEETRPVAGAVAARVAEGTVGPSPGQLPIESLQAKEVLDGAAVPARDVAREAPREASRELPRDRASTAPEVIAPTFRTVDHEFLALEAMPCSDHHTGCAHWAAKGECHKNKEYMHNSCAGSCGLCTMDGSPLPLTESAPAWLERRATQHPVAQKLAAQHSGDPASQRRLQPTDATADDRCTDFHSRCAAWSMAGECSKNPGFMRASCRKSCGSCAPAALAT